MARLLTYKDGRLRTGRVAMLSFFMLILCLATLFEFRRSMDHVLVSVKHVFEPQVQKAKKAVPKPVKQIAETPAKAISDSSIAGKKIESEPVAEIAGKQSDEAGSGALQSQKPDQNASPKQEKAFPGKAGAKPIRSENTDQNHPREMAQVELGVPEKPKPAAKTKPEAPDGKKEENREKISEQPEIRLNVSDRLNRVATWNEPVREDEKIDLAGGLNRLFQNTKDTDPKQADTETPKRIAISKKAAEPHKNTADAGRSGSLKVDVQQRSVTVSSGEYLKLFQGWRAAGSGSENGHKVPLRVEHLKSAYVLFQMKPVAVVGKRLFFDLTDGTRIPEASLGAYSTTVFRVDNPWKKWADGLSKAGIRESDALEVRYYMYDFVKNAIYNRAHQAVVWCKEAGRLNDDAPLSEVDVLGRVFVIKQQGGGRFGVFVPVSLDTGDGQTIPIDPSCFADQPDVRALQTAGLL